MALPLSPASSGYGLLSLLFACGFCLCIPLHAQLPPTLSPHSQVSVLTMGPSQKNVYAAFGHSALRVQDTTQQLDILFNYGVFDFNPPAFYFTFLKGALWYKLEVFEAKQFLRHMEKENRSIQEQILALSFEEEQALYALLLENHKPENQYYFYNYVYNNCATKIRDVLEAALPGQLLLTTPVPPKALSFRSLMNASMQDFPWFKLGINLALGSEVDLKADARTYMFLPDYVASAIEHATLYRQDAQVPLGTHTRWLFHATPHTIRTFPTPAQVGWAVLVLVLCVTYIQVKKKAQRFSLDAVVLLTYGLLGLCLLFLWTSTEHLSSYNYNLLWASPLHIAAVILWYLPATRVWVIRYFMLLAGILLLILSTLLFNWPVWPQVFPQDMLPFLLALFLRLLYHIYGYRLGYT